MDTLKNYEKIRKISSGGYSSMYKAKNIEIKEEIAKNDALKENLFILFVCINT